MSSSINNFLFEIQFDLFKVKGFETRRYSSLVHRIISWKRDIKQKAESFTTVDDSDVADSDSTPLEAPCLVQEST